jgi:hypothetical protein
METSNLLIRKVNTTDHLTFLLAGNAHVTFRNSETNNRYTYKIRVSKNGTVHFVSVLYGSDNDSDYTYIGCIFDKFKFKITKSSKLKEDDVRVKVFQYVFGNILRNSLPDNIEVWHEGRCGRCGRLLTVPESIESGFGPECIGLL